MMMLLDSKRLAKNVTFFDVSLSLYLFDAIRLVDAAHFDYSYKTQTNKTTFCLSVSIKVCMYVCLEPTDSCPVRGQEKIPALYFLPVTFFVVEHSMCDVNKQSKQQATLVTKAGRPRIKIE
jgi:hypothetical protein